jgi:hypothetical protein
MNQKNELGYYAAQQVELAAATIRIASRSLDLENNTEEEILDALQLINRATWEAKSKIEKDIAERKDRQE